MKVAATSRRQAPRPLAKNINFIHLPSFFRFVFICCRSAAAIIIRLPHLLSHPPLDSLSTCQHCRLRRIYPNACVHITNSNGSVSRLPFWNIYPRKRGAKRRKYYSSMASGIHNFSHHHANPRLDPTSPRRLIPPPHPGTRQSHPQFNSQK